MSPAPTELNYPAELPVTAYRSAILDALRRHPVVIVAGDTGSGKTTQLPKMALESGGKRIAVTQPRRLAAVTMAERVANELKVELGGLVGYQHRFGRKVSAETRIKFQTDGVLLAETRNDPLLRRYDTIIVDEAHERSLNVDFLLGILKRILLRRRDLKVIVSSATLDTERFAAFFDAAPVISVPGRLFPIEYRYRPPAEDEERDLAREVTDAVREIPAGDDILVFLPGERDIRETADELTHCYGDANDVIPLLASLPASEQQRAFKPSSRRRIVLATNVAETSVTIPGIRAVIDSGLARISRYVHRTQVQRLQIEPISQAYARQRAGRCGRLGPGTCLRLYSEEDFAQRDAYTPPEVLRSSLAGVILTMLDLKLGDIAEFPFIDPPRTTMIHEGFRELLELGAVTRDIDREPQLSPLGRQLARMPVEPRLARMLVAASDAAVLDAVLPVVAALSCDDPKRRPLDEREKADQAHAPFRVPNSDFLGTLSLWTWWNDSTRELSQSKARALAKKTYLSYPKMREWRDLVRQLSELCKGLKLYGLEPQLKTQSADFSERFHRALLSGLLGRIGRYDEEEHDYRGAHALRFALHPASVLTKKVKHADSHASARNKKTEARNQSTFPGWIMAGELVDTTRLYARNAAVLDPTWIEPVAGELCKRSYRAPEWDARTGYARVLEQVTLYGLVIVPSRRRDLSGINPQLARRIFIENGLIGGAFPQPPPPVQANNALLTDLRRRAEKTRRPEIFDTARLYAHFDELLPAEVTSADALRRWFRRASADEITRFRLKRSEWWPAETVSDRNFPEKIVLGGVTLALDYRHTPDDPETDGITCTVRQAEAHVLKLWKSDWLVPGALPEKLAWMLSVLPSSLRRVLTPLDEKIAVLMDVLRPGAEPLEEAVRRAVFEQWAFRIPADAWSHQRVPPHFQVRFVVRDNRNGRVLADSRNLEAVLATVLPKDESSVRASVQKPVESACSWTFGTIPESTEGNHAGWKVRRYPALRDTGEGVTVCAYDDSRTAERVHAQGVVRLYRLTLPANLKIGVRSRDLGFDAARHLKELDYDVARLAEDVYLGSIRAALVADRPSVRTEAEFVRRATEERNALVAAQSEILKLVTAALADAGDLTLHAEADDRLAPETASDIETQVAWLVYRGFPAHVPLAQLRHYARYFKALRLRLERARNAPASDRSKETLFAPYWSQYVAAATGKNKTKRDPAKLAEYRWLLAEYQVSLFAQELKTAVPVSPKRLDAKWAETEWTAENR